MYTNTVGRNSAAACHGIHWSGRQGDGHSEALFLIWITLVAATTSISSAACMRRDPAGVLGSMRQLCSSTDAEPLDNDTPWTLGKAGQMGGSQLCISSATHT